MSIKPQSHDTATQTPNTDVEVNLAEYEDKAAKV